MFNSGGAAAWRKGFCIALAASIPMVGEASVDLSTVYQKALAQSPGYQAAEAQYRVGLEARPMALSKVLPQLGAQGSAAFAYEHYRGSSFETPGDLRGGDLTLANELSHVDVTDSYKIPKYSVVLQQAVFNAESFIGLKESDLQLSANRLALDQARSDLLLGIAQAYFGVLAAKDGLHFSQAKVDTYRQQLDQATVRHKTGLMADADFESIKAEYQGSLADVAQAQSNVEVALSQLALLTAEEITDIKPLSEDVQLPALQPDKIEPWVTQAVDQNLTVLLDGLETKIAKLDYDKARAARFPQVSMFGTYSYEHPDGGYPGSHQKINEAIGLSIQQPIYTGGAIDSSIRVALATWDKAKATEDQARIGATQSVRAAFFSAHSGPSRLDALKQAMTAAAASEYSTRVGYEVGTKTTADLLLAINQRYKTESDYSSARYQYLMYTLQLKNATGILAGSDLEAINQWLK
jgi:outer membrane protein